MSAQNEDSKIWVLFSFQRVGEALKVDSWLLKRKNGLEKHRWVVLVCRGINVFILGTEIFFFWVGEGDNRDWLCYFFNPQICREWRETRLPWCPCAPMVWAMLLVSWTAWIFMPGCPGSVKCSWAQALSQVSNGHFGLQFLLLTRPPISESCFNKHSIKRKKPPGDRRYPITEKQEMLTEESTAHPQVLAA